MKNLYLFKKIFKKCSIEYCLLLDLSLHMSDILIKVPVLTNLNNNYSVKYLMRTHSSISMNTQKSEELKLKELMY
jgi:hypothetical protein